MLRPYTLDTIKTRMQTATQTATSSATAGASAGARGGTAVLRIPMVESFGAVARGMLKTEGRGFHSSS